MVGVVETSNGGASAEWVELLIDGARYDDAEDVEAALEAGADVNATDESGRTALHMAAANGHAAMVKRLVDAGALLDKPNSLGNTALHWACVNGQIEAVAVLMEGGASPCALNSAERTPVDEALDKRRQDIVDLIGSFNDRLAPPAGSAAEAELPFGAADGADGDGADGSGGSGGSDGSGSNSGGSGAGQ